MVLGLRGLTDNGEAATSAGRNVSALSVVGRTGLLVDVQSLHLVGGIIYIAHHDCLPSLVAKFSILYCILVNSIRINQITGNCRETDRLLRMYWDSYRANDLSAQILFLNFSNYKFNLYFILKY